MLRCVLCGSSRMDSQGMGCARCGGSPAVPWEQRHVNEDTKNKLLAHADELKTFGVTLEKQQPLEKDAGLILGAVALGLQVVESLSPGVLRSLVHCLRDLAIPEEQILRLRLDEPEKISELLQEPTPVGERKPSRPASRKRAAKGPRSKN
jgi:hypothetical protein